MLVLCHFPGNFHDSLFYQCGRGSPVNAPGLHISGHNRTGRKNGMRSNFYSRPHPASGAKPGSILDCDRFDD